MKNKTKTAIILGLGLFLLGSVHSCKKAKGTDKELFDMATETGGFTWYKNSDILLDKSSGSGHPQPFLRTRYNAIAATQLGPDGKVLPGAVFPEGSFVVKELINNASSIDRYAILYKNTSSNDADANGWVWGYINADGIVAEPASNKGTACISCHLQDENIDYMLMNKYFP